MTREDAHEELHFGDRLDYITFHEVHMGIEQIFDDFDAMICENCAHYKDEVCTNDESPICADFVVSTFGCNKYKLKGKQ